MLAASCSCTHTHTNIHTIAHARVNSHTHTPRTHTFLLYYSIKVPINHWLLIGPRRHYLPLSPFSLAHKHRPDAKEMGWQARRAPRRQTVLFLFFSVFFFFPLLIFSVSHHAFFYLLSFMYKYPNPKLNEGIKFKLRFNKYKSSAPAKDPGVWDQG